MKRLIAAAVLALIPSSVLASSALEQLGQASGFDIKPMVMQVKDLKQMVERPALPPRPVDMLASCSIIDAKTFRAYTLDEAVGVVNGCFNQLITTEGAKPLPAYSIKAEAGRFAVRACPAAQSDGVFTCQAFQEVEGLVLTITGTLPNDALVENLEYSVSQRGGKLLGFRAEVSNKATINK